MNETIPSGAAASSASSIDVNWPSWLFLVAVATNTAIIAWLSTKAPVSSWPALGASVLLQSVFMIGMQEAKHQCIHGQFLAKSSANDIVGVLSAALFAVNFVGYRCFHLQHHRRTCQADDPEGLLYGLSWKTRLMALCGALETLYAAVHINWFSLRYVPRAKRLRWHVNNLAIAAVLGALCTGLWRAPWPLLCAWLLPYCLFAWWDFLFTQAEHYGVPIVDGTTRRAPADITLNLQLPVWLSWLTLHRTLHRIHHHAPATRWFHAPTQSAALQSRHPGQQTTLPAFFRHWMQNGPRLWK